METGDADEGPTKRRTVQLKELNKHDLDCFVRAVEKYEVLLAGNRQKFDMR